MADSDDPPKCLRFGLETCRENRNGGCMVIGPVGGAHFVCERDFNERQQARRKILDGQHGEGKE